MKAYRIPKNPDFSRVIYHRGIEKTSQIKRKSGEIVFRLMVDLLKKSGIKTDAEIDYGDLRGGCKIDYQGATVYTFTGNVRLRSGGEGLSMADPILKASYLHGEFTTNILVHNPRDVSQMVDADTKKLSNDISKLVEQTKGKSGLDCSHYPLVIGTQYDEASMITAHLDILNRHGNIEVPQLDSFSSLIGKVDRMLLAYLRNRINIKLFDKDMDEALVQFFGNRLATTDQGLYHKLMGLESDRSRLNLFGRDSP